MKTIRNFKDMYAKQEGFKNWQDFLNFAKDQGLDEREIGYDTLMKEYAQLAIIEDRKNLLEHIQLSFVPHDEEAWEEKNITRESILEFYMDGEDKDWAYQQLKERDGFTIEVNEDSIINAPNIELL